MARPLKTETLRGVVLRRVDVGEADRILSVLTAERGRIEVRVPSARKSRKRFGGVDLYTLIDADIDDSRRRPRLHAATVVRDHPGIREDVVRLALAGHVAELVVQAAPEEQEAAELMRLTEAALAALDVPPDRDVGGRGWARAFELKLAHVLGVRPSLLRCAASGVPIDDGPTAWSPAHGGVLVGEARAEDPRARAVQRTTLRRMHQALMTPLAAQADVAWTPAEEAEAGDVMASYTAEHVGQRGRAREFLNSVLRSSLAAMLVLSAGCVASTPPTDVRVQGWLFDTPAPAEDAAPITGATLNAYDDDGELLDEGSEPFPEALGFYRVSGLPLDVPVHLEFAPPVAMDDAGDPALSFWVPTVRSGRTALDDLWVDDGVFHLRERAELHRLIDDLNAGAARAGLRIGYADPDPAVDDQGGALLGRLLASELVPGRRFAVTDANGTREAWYRAEGALRPSVGVDATGEFVLAGIAAGPVDVEILDEAGEPTGRAYRTRAVEDGTTVLLDFIP